MGILKVMKFGGTSVADADAFRRVISIVGAEVRNGRPPVVVTSAMARVTDRLLALADEALQGERRPALNGLDDLRQRHHQEVAKLFEGPRARSVTGLLEPVFDDLQRVLTAVSALRELSPRSRDAIAAAGELLSSLVLAEALGDAGIDAAWVDPRRVLVTDDLHTAATPLVEPTAEAVAREIVPHLGAGRVPVTGGYVGATVDRATTTLGRGGSDYSAAILGAALAGAGAAPPSGIEIQIWTDVDGMLTADPRVVASPSVVSHLSFGEASELAYFGAKVLHPSTILPAVRSGIPVRILNSLRPGGAGTIISAEASDDGRPIAALACKRNITVIEVTSTRMLMAHGFLRRLFEVFERYRTPVDVVTTSEVSVSVTIDDNRYLGRIASELGEFADISVERQMALLCAVGDNLRHDGSSAVRLLASLDGFALRMVSQASTRRNVTVVLQERDLTAAMAHLHEVWLKRPASDPVHA